MRKHFPCQNSIVCEVIHTTQPFVGISGLYTVLAYSAVKAFYHSHCNPNFFTRDCEEMIVRYLLPSARPARRLAYLT